MLLFYHSRVGTVYTYYKACLCCVCVCVLYLRWPLAEITTLEITILEIPVTDLHCRRRCRRE